MFSVAGRNIDLKEFQFNTQNAINYQILSKLILGMGKMQNKSRRSLHGLTSILINDVCTLYFSNGANMLTFEAERIVLKYILFNQFHTFGRN